MSLILQHWSKYSLTYSVKCTHVLLDHSQSTEQSTCLLVFDEKTKGDQDSGKIHVDEQVEKKM